MFIGNGYGNQHMKYKTTTGYTNYVNKIHYGSWTNKVNYTADFWNLDKIVFPQKFNTAQRNRHLKLKVSFSTKKYDV